MTDNLSCFLDDSEWQSVLWSVLDEHPVTSSPFSDRGTVVISLWSIILSLPRIFKDVQAAIFSDQFLAPHDLSNFQSRVTDLDTRVSQWRSTYEQLLMFIPDQSSEDIKAEKRFETLGLCLTCLIILKRLTIALDPLASSTLETEMEAQTLGNRILDLEQRAIAANPRAGLFMRFKKELAHATLATGDEWRISSIFDSRVGANGLISKWVFEHWVRLKGRKV